MQTWFHGTTPLAGRQCNFLTTATVFSGFYSCT